MFAYCNNNPVTYVDGSGTIGVYIGYAAYGEASSAVVFASKKDDNWVSRTNKPKGSGKRQPGGERERNKRHPNGEEHSLKPKGNGMPIRRKIALGIDPNSIYEASENTNLSTSIMTSNITSIGYLRFDSEAANTTGFVMLLTLIPMATMIVTVAFGWGRC